MSNVNIFSNATKAAPKSDQQIIRIDFEKPDLVGRPPSPKQAGDLSISHIPNASKTSG